MELRMVVCVKQVPDPDGPPSSFQVNQETKRVTPQGIPPVISPFDENALEAALRIKEAVGGYITLLSLGRGFSKAVFLKAMATGADRLLLVEGNSLDPQALDSWSTARLLAAAIKRDGPYQLILTGRQAADTNAGQVGLGIAQLLGIPSISLAQKVEVVEGGLRVERVLPDGYEIVESPLPALVTVSHEVGELRYPPLPAIKAARSLPQDSLRLEDLGVNLLGNLLQLTRLAPPSRERTCVLMEGESPEEAAEKLALRLLEDKVL